MVAPKGPGNMIRMIFEEGFGVPAIFSIHQDSTGNAKEIVLALCKKMGFTRPGVFEESFRNETHTDLFGEQAVLCGGITELIKKAFEVLVEAGYPPEMAYFEVLHETKLVVDLINRGGLSYMWREVSNTAEYGGLTRRERIVTEESKEEMRRILREIQDGTFSKQWISEFDNGMTNMRRMEKEEEELQVEKVGKEIRREFFNRE
jgi:ketol-acid reductoisomerase